jgi:hypothetical protein
MLLLLSAAVLAGLPLAANSQSLLDSEYSSGAIASTTTVQPDLTYVRPTGRTTFNNYLFETIGPYPIVITAATAGIGQASNAVPEWNQGAEGYARRFGSDFGIGTVSTTTRFGLSEVFKEDALYYRCDCRGALPRLSHAMISTLMARRGDDGHRVFSIPALVAPYVGAMTAVYGWYPSRYGAKDAFREGNYSLLTYMGGNIALEFIYSGPHSLLHRMHLNNAHGAPDQGADR